MESDLRVVTPSMPSEAPPLGCRRWALWYVTITKVSIPYRVCYVSISRLMVTYQMAGRAGLPGAASERILGTTMNSTREKLLANERALAGAFTERTAPLRGAMLAVLSKQHVLWIGPPGTAKSAMARAFFAQFEGGVQWQGMLTRQTREDQVLGALDAPAFAAGREEYLLAGHLTPAHFAFIDEVFKATSGLLNAFLGLLNERRVSLGPVRIDSPLVTAIGASNEWGEDDSVEALDDRFLIRAWVDYVSSRAARIEMLRRSAEHTELPALAPVTLEELCAAQAEAAALPIEPSVHASLADLREQLVGAGVSISDRRLIQCEAVLRAAAWLEGDPEVGPEHLACLAHVLWMRPPEIPIVEAALANVDRGVIGEISAIVDRALEPYRELVSPRLPDGTWRDAGDQRAFTRAAPGLCERLSAAAGEIRSRYGSGVSERVAIKVRRLVGGELKAAFLDCQAHGGAL